MSFEESKALVHRFIEKSWHNLDLLDEILADEIVFTGGERVNRDAIKQSFAWLNCGFPDVRTTIEWIVTQGDDVVAGWRSKATHTQEWDGIPPTQKKAEWIGFSKIRIVDGKIVEWWQLWDAFTAMAQIGFIPNWVEMIEQAKHKA